MNNNVAEGYEIRLFSEITKNNNTEAPLSELCG